MQPYHPPDLPLHFPFIPPTHAPLMERDPFDLKNDRTNPDPSGTTHVPGDARKLADLIRGIRVAMLTTTITPAPEPGIGGAIQAAHPDTHIDLRRGTHTRPMYNQPIDPDTFSGELYFMTSASSSMVREITDNARVLMTYAAPDKNRYVVVHGTAECVRDPAKARELWNIHAKGWWPDGPEDPELMLLHVFVDSAEYWDGPSNTSYMLSLLKAVTTGTRITTRSEHGVVA